MGRAVECFMPFVPPKVTRDDMEAHVFWRNDKPVGVVRKNDRLMRAEDLMRPHVERIARATSCEPLRGRIRQTVRVQWPTGGVHYQGEPYTDPPGYDGWVSVLNDLCQSCGLITSDCHIFDAHVRKSYADPAGVFVRFREVP